MCNLYYADLWIMPTIGSKRALAVAIAAMEFGIITVVPPEIAALFRVVNRYVGNLAPMPGVFPAIKSIGGLPRSLPYCYRWQAKMGDGQ